MSKVRRPAVAGQFYPAEAPRLRRLVEQYLEEASENGKLPRAIIAPHAGYIYSGPIAASAYVRLRAGRNAIRRVVLLGPAHRVPVRGLAASSADAFATPLGEVPLDREAIDRILELPQVHVQDDAHAPEHGLEVHLPFLQTVLADFRLVPLVVGEAAPAAVAEVLAQFAGDPHTLIVVSSDLSHYQDYDNARRLDQEASMAIEHLRPLAAGQACGRHAINGLLHLARERGWQAHTVDLRNSGDTAGPRHQVVGYGAYLFSA
jgi:AmmeMemoRadiSam system protein B